MASLGINEELKAGKLSDVGEHTELGASDWYREYLTV